jgi:hypothetical protein
MCVPGPCLPGFANCNGDPTDGCEVQLAADNFSCGRCGHTCMPTTETCNLGRCCGALPAGSYQATCTGCEACDGTLSCQCQDSMGNPQPTSIQIVPCPLGYTNCNGVLLCNGC